MEKRSYVIRVIIALMVFGIFWSFGGNSYAVTSHSRIVCIQYTFLNSPQDPAIIGTTTTSKNLITSLGGGFFTINAVQLDAPSGDLPYISGGVGHMVGQQLIFSATTTQTPNPNVFTGQVTLDYSNPSNLTGTFFLIGNTYDPSSNTFVNYYMDGTADQVPCQ